VSIFGVLAEVPHPNVVLFDVRVGFHGHVPHGPLSDTCIRTRGSISACHQEGGFSPEARWLDLMLR